MNPLTQSKNTTIRPLLIALVLVCLGLSLTARAVVPPPDGGYPGGNTAEGQAALLSLTTGGFNTAAGWLSLRALTTGGFNTAIGAGSLVLNTADQNTATGAGALLSNTTGNQNMANGAFALFNNTMGIQNTANGALALLNNTEGDQNTANGFAALTNNINGSSNTAIGFVALSSNTNGNANTAVGGGALGSNVGGNTNTAIGDAALANNTSGTDNIGLGTGSGSNIITAHNVIAIGTAGADVSNSCYIGQIFGVTSAGGTAVFINSDGKLGTTTSSQRFKEAIKPMEGASEALFALKPVTFHYKKQIDPAAISQFGLVAEDVEKVNPDLVVCDKEGKPYSVRYEQVNAMLLNEFLKEHTKVEEQEATITKLKSMLAKQETIDAHQQEQIEALTAGLQKVNAQLEVIRPAPQTALNNP